MPLPQKYIWISHSMYYALTPTIDSTSYTYISSQGSTSCKKSNACLQTLLATYYVLEAPINNTLEARPSCCSRNHKREVFCCPRWNRIITSRVWLKATRKAFRSMENDRGSIPQKVCGVIHDVNQEDITSFCFFLVTRKQLYVANYMRKYLERNYLKQANERDIWLSTPLGVYHSHRRKSMWTHLFALEGDQCF